MYEILEQKLEQSNSIPNINRGGCVINALAIKAYIELHHPEMNPTIVYIPHEDGGNDDALNCNNAEMLECFHAVVHCDNKNIDDILFIDSNGINLECSGDYYDEIPDYMAISDVNMVYKWNSCFDRDHIEEIEEIFGIEVRAEILGMSA